MSDLSLLLRGYASVVDEQFRPVDADELRERDPAPPPPASRVARVIDLRAGRRNRFLLAAAAAVVVLLVGAVAFAHRGTRDPSSVETNGDSNVITGGPSTSSSTTIPPCPPGAASGCVGVPGPGSSLPGTVPGTDAPGSSLAPVTPSPGSTDGLPLAVVPGADANGSGPGGLVLPGTTTARPASSTTTTPSATTPPTIVPTTSTSTSTTSTTAPTTGRVSGRFDCSPSPCPSGFATSFSVRRVWPNPATVTIALNEDRGFDGRLEPGTYTLGVHNPCVFQTDAGDTRDFTIAAGDWFRWDYLCTKPAGVP
jgi:hypothetical protein